MVKSQTHRQMTMFSSVQVLFFLLLVLFVQGERRDDLICSSKESSTNSNVVDCKCSRNSSNCLICKTSKEVEKLWWYNDGNSSKLAVDSFVISTQETIKLNICSLLNHSMMITTPCSNENQAVYSCRSRNLTITKFVLKLQVTPVVLLNGGNMTGENSLLVTPNKDETIQCKVLDAVLPISITWYVNNGTKTEVSTETFNNGTVAISYYTVHDVSSNFKLHCSVEGPYISKQTTSLSILVGSNQHDDQEQKTCICDELVYSQSFPTSVCNASSCDHVCLVCPVYKENNVEWFNAGTYIAHGDIYFGERSGESVNSCHEKKASLSVKPCEDENESFIRCQQGEKVLANFTLICEIDDKVEIPGDRPDKDNNQGDPHVTDAVPVTTDNHPNMTMYIITVGVTISIAVGCGLTFALLYSLRKRGQSTTSKGLTPSIEMEDNVCYVGMVDETTTTMSLEYIVQTNLTDSNRHILKPILNKKVLPGLPFEYWNAQMSIDGSIKMECFAKKLSDEATIGDYTTLKLLAESLSSFQMSEGFVKLLHISTQTIPFGFFYETMRCGTLQDHVMNHFRKISLINKTIKRQLSYFYRPVLKELLIFAVNIAQAMHFLASQKFCHPALSLRKVLMTPQGSCKLYDIYPNNLCMERVKHLMKKKNPPTAWMATEIFLLDKYFLKSDSWNFSVFLWELLSIGKIPFAGISQEDIKAKVLDEFTLSRPYVCPKDMFRVMVSCWQKNHTMRPSCIDILKAIRCEYEKFHEKYQDCDYSEIPE